MIYFKFNIFVLIINFVFIVKSQYLIGWDEPNYKGRSAGFGGTIGKCHYVSDQWNDRIRSARTTTGICEVWDTYDCKGYSLTVDSEGYYNIGKFISAYRCR
jgi:hypothetical protein